MSTLEVLADPDALAQRVADWLLELTDATQGRVSLCLSGGSTPERLYRRMAAMPFAWPRLHLFWGDERFVPHDHPDSNYRMTRLALLAHAPVPIENIHPIPTGGASPDAAAQAYERELRAFHGTDEARPLFDAVLLGLGTDGHTASLFPGTPALEERKRLAVAVTGAKPEPRVTLTYPALESTRHAAFLVSGAEKRDIFARVRGGDPALPAARLRPLGETLWFADRACCE